MGATCKKKDIEGHENVLKHVRLKCDGFTIICQPCMEERTGFVKAEVAFKNFADHLAYKCSKQELICYYCSDDQDVRRAIRQTISVASYEKHLLGLDQEYGVERREFYYIKCARCGEGPSLVKDIDHHDEHVCEENFKNCDRC